MDKLNQSAGVKKAQEQLLDARAKERAPPTGVEYSLGTSMVHQWIQGSAELCSNPYPGILRVTVLLKKSKLGAQRPHPTRSRLLPLHFASPFRGQRRCQRLLRLKTALPELR
eukprot:scaffold180_cov311-Pinguiococcus_pyrenoidosus.AAC.36